MPTTELNRGRQVIFAAITYIAGRRGVLQVSEQVQCANAEAAQRRAHKLMDAGRVLGVDVIRQACDPEAGEYEEPQYLLRLGRVPDVMPV